MRVLKLINNLCWRPIVQPIPQLDEARKGPCATKQNVLARFAKVTGMYHAGAVERYKEDE